MHSFDIESLHKLIERGNAEIKDEINGLRNSLQEEITTVTSKITFLENENSLLKKRVLDLERRDEKYNFIVYGVEETSENPSEELLKIVEDVLKINISIHNYRDIFRVGKPSTEKTRPIVAEVLCYDLKSQILNAANLLREDLRKLGVIFSKDYAEEDYIRTKFLYNQLKLAKSTYPEERLENDQLYLNNEENTILSYDELLELSVLLPLIDEYIPKYEFHSIPTPKKKQNLKSFVEK
ncbi:hypothetical protein JTB14_005025 [Gonioctena quinquepunctata]|nr:hypothetical protein JTB14_005025 [Gonioctena quinquepunctata]